MGIWDRYHHICMRPPVIFPQGWTALTRMPIANLLVLKMPEA